MWDLSAVRSGIRDPWKRDLTCGTAAQVHTRHTAGATHAAALIAGTEVLPAVLPAARAQVRVAVADARGKIPEKVI
jgi:hypothetical protein